MPPSSYPGRYQESSSSKDLSSGSRTSRGEVRKGRKVTHGEHLYSQEEYRDKLNEAKKVLLNELILFQESEF